MQILQFLGVGSSGLSQSSSLLVPEIDVCKYALMIEGVLTKRAKYYTISNDDQMEEEIVRKGVQMMERIGVTANVTV